MFYNPVIEDHIAMLNDVGRNMFFKKTIQTLANDKVCLDVGAGTGILTDYALEFGARKVYCIEIRKAKAQFLKDKYKGKNVEVIEEDFLNVRLKNIDLIIMEVTGCQFKNNFPIKRFFQHIKNQYDNAECTANQYNLKAHVFDGIIESKPNILIDGDHLPAGFYEDCEKRKTIRETENRYVYKLSKENCFDEIGFDLDLEHYKDATIFLDDEISYNDLVCRCESTYRYFDLKPLRIEVRNAKRKMKFKWDKNIFKYF